MVLQRWDRCHPHLPTGWMRSELFLILNHNPKNRYGNHPHPLTHIPSGGLMIAQRQSLQTVQTRL